MAAIDGLVPQRQAPPPPRPSTSSNKSLSLQLTAGSMPHSTVSSFGGSTGSTATLVERDSAPAPPRVPPSKKGPPPPQKPSRQNNHRSSPHDTLRSNNSDIAHQHSHSSSSSKSSGRSHHHYDPEYTSNRSTFKGVFSNIVNSMSGNVSSLYRSTSTGWSILAIVLTGPDLLSANRSAFVRQKDGDLVSVQPGSFNTCGIQS